MERDLAHHRIEAVLDPPGQQAALLGLRRGGQQPVKRQPLGEDRGRLGQGQGRIGQQCPLTGRQGVVHRMAQLMRQGQDIAPLAHPVQEYIGMPVGADRMAIGTRLLARPRLAVDPRLVEETPGPFGELGAQIGETLQHQRPALGPVEAARGAGLDRGVAVPLVQPVLAQRLGTEHPGFTHLDQDTPGHLCQMGGQRRVAHPGHGISRATMASAASSAVMVSVSIWISGSTGAS